MKLPSLLWRGLLVVAACAGLLQWWLVGQAHDAAARFAARLVPHGQLKYERLWPWPWIWGGGRAWGVSFTSDGMLGLSLQLPPGTRVSAREVRLYQVHRDDQGLIDRFHASFLGLRVPVTPHHAPAVRTPDPARHPRPTLHDLSYPAIDMDVEVHWQYLPEARLARVRVNALAPDMGQALVQAQLEGSPGTFLRAQDQILIRKVEIDYVDRGLLGRARDMAISRARLNPAQWRAAIAAHLDARKRAGTWKWESDSDAALRELLREPGALRAVFDPPGQVILRNLRLYPAADWPAVLGFRLEANPMLRLSPPKDSAATVAGSDQRS